MIDTSWRRNLLICVCLAATIVVVYSPVCHFEFLNYDDDDYVTANAHVQSGLTLHGLAWAFTSNYAANWFPLTWLSHMLDWQLWGGRAGAHHRVNVFLHVVNALLLFGVLTRMTASPWRSALVAGLFALHPLHVESVAWVSERKDVLSTCFWLLTVWAYVRYVERPGGWRYLSALGLYALGLMAKPMVVTLPFVLLLLDYWPLGRTPWAKPAARENASTPLGQLINEKLPFLALAALSCALTYWAQHGGGAVASLDTVPLAMRIANALLSYVGYIGKTLWPVRLAVFYPMPARFAVAAVLLAGVGLAGITAAVLGSARRAPWFVTGWFWYLGILVPVIGLVHVGQQSMADRYTYVPSIGLFIMMCWSVPSPARKRPIMKVITYLTAGAVLAICAALSRIQVEYWKDSETLFRHALDVTRDNWLAHSNLGVALAQTGKVQEAITHYEQALRIKPDYAKVHFDLGIAFGRAGRVPEEIEQLEHALRLQPDFADAHNNLGIALVQAGRIPEGIEQLEHTLQILPEFAEAHYNLGIALGRAGRIPEAIAHLEHAVRIKPDYAEAHNNLGVALAQTGNIPEAIAHYEQALRIKPDLADAHFNLGLALEKLGRTQEAIEQFEQALRLRPDFAPAKNALTRLQAGQ
jgi:tetratricopeptide (TPR) repeat protein